MYAIVPDAVGTEPVWNISANVNVFSFRLLHRQVTIELQIGGSINTIYRIVPGAVDTESVWNISVNGDVWNISVTYNRRNDDLGTLLTSSAKKRHYGQGGMLAFFTTFFLHFLSHTLA